MVTLIRQEKLEDKIAEDISQVSEFDFAAWDFLSAIYEFSWDKLIANKNNKLLRLMPPGNSMDKGKGYDDMISCATCSLSQHLMQ